MNIFALLSLLGLGVGAYILSESAEAAYIPAEPNPYDPYFPPQGFGVEQWEYEYVPEPAPQSSLDLEIDITPIPPGSGTEFDQWGFPVGHFESGEWNDPYIAPPESQTVAESAYMLPTKPPVELNDNLAAFLGVIRYAEGTADADGYRRLFGGELFDSFADHPRIVVRKSGYTTTAAGAYQFLSRTWDEVAGKLGLTDFSPENQDLAAIQRIIDRGAIHDVLAGRFDAAISKTNKEWASLPGSPYGQPVRKLSELRTLFNNYGGTFA